MHIGRGVGAGLIINGQVHHGPEWTAGEIGYLLVCGGSLQPVRKSQVGALEAAIGTAGIERQWRELAAQNGDAEEADLGSGEILDRAAQGDPRAQRIVDKTSDYLAMVCSYPSLILNCSLIVFGGELEAHPALRRPPARLNLKSTISRIPRLAITALGTKAQLKEALRLAISQFVEGLRCQ